MKETDGRIPGFIYFVEYKDTITYNRPAATYGNSISHLRWGSVATPAFRNKQTTDGRQ